MLEFSLRPPSTTPLFPSPCSAFSSPLSSQGLRSSVFECLGRGLVAGQSAEIRMDHFEGHDQLGLGANQSCSDELHGNSTIICVKQEPDQDYQAGCPIICVKEEKDVEDNVGHMSSDVNVCQMFEFKGSDADLPDPTPLNGELLMVWEHGDPIPERNRDTFWPRKDPPCEIWSCKLPAHYGHSTGPSRCADHREAWMVMFGKCDIEGCFRFGVVGSSEEESIRCEGHAQDERIIRPKTGLTHARALEHLVEDNTGGPGDLGLGLGGGDESQHEIIYGMERPPVDDECAAVAENGVGSELNVGTVEEHWVVPPDSNNQISGEASETSSGDIQAAISRLQEEYGELKQRMLKVEVEIARLLALQRSGSDLQQPEAQTKRTTRQRPRQTLPLEVSTLPPTRLDGNLPVNGAPGRLSMDGYNWRKYGEMPLPGIPHPRVFYGCTNIGCIARKIEEHTIEGQVKHFYEGVHNHLQPRRSPGVQPLYKRRKKYHDYRAQNVLFNDQ